MAQSAGDPVVRVTKDRDTLWNIATDLGGRYPGATRSQIMVALLRANPEAFVQGNLHRLRVGRPLTLPSASSVTAEPVVGAAQLVQQHLVAMTTSQAPIGLPVRVSDASAAATPVEAADRGASSPVPATGASIGGAASASTSASAADVSPVAVEPASGLGRWLPWGLGLLALAGGWLLWQQRGRPTAPDEVRAALREEARSPRGPTSALLRQQVISNAAAEMARAVEEARSAHVMVTPTAGAAAALLPPTARRHLLDPEETDLQVDIVRAWIEVERWDDARELLTAMEAQPLTDARRSTLDDLRSRLPSTRAA